MTRTTRIRVTNRTTRYDGNGDHAAATRYDNDGGGEDQTVTMKMKAARKTKRRHGEDDGDRKDEEDDEGEDEEDDACRAQSIFKTYLGGRRPLSNQNCSLVEN